MARRSVRKPVRSALPPAGREQAARAEERVIEIRLEADLAMGRHARAIPMLETLVTEYPYRERLWFLLADALARDGRRMEALRTLRRLERGLREVGLSPSRELQELEQIIDEDPPHVAGLSRHG